MQSSKHRRVGKIPNHRITRGGGVRRRGKEEEEEKEEEERDEMETDAQQDERV